MPRKRDVTVHSPEGIDTLPDGDLVVSEDNINGRLLRVRRDGKQMMEVMLGGLNRPEGLVVKPDGTVIFAEWLAERGRQRLWVIHGKDSR